MIMLGKKRRLCFRHIDICTYSTVRIYHYGVFAPGKAEGSFYVTAMTTIMGLYDTHHTRMMGMGLFREAGILWSCVGFDGTKAHSADRHFRDHQMRNVRVMHMNIFVNTLRGLLP